MKNRCSRSKTKKTITPKYCTGTAKVIHHLMKEKDGSRRQWAVGCHDEKPELIQRIDTTESNWYSKNHTFAQVVAQLCGMITTTDNSIISVLAHVDIVVAGAISNQLLELATSWLFTTD
jgi:hypothetical protein